MLTPPLFADVPGDNHEEFPLSRIGTFHEYNRWIALIVEKRPAGKLNTNERKTLMISQRALFVVRIHACQLLVSVIVASHSTHSSNPDAITDARK